MKTSAGVIGIPPADPRAFVAPAISALARGFDQLPLGRAGEPSGGRAMTYHDPIGDIERGWTLPATQCPIEISHHAVEQANLRVFRSLDLELTRTNVSALLPNAWVSRRGPTWMRHAKRRKGYGRAHSWLTNESPRIAFALIRYETDYKVVATTAFTDQDNNPVGATVRGFEKLAALTETLR